MPTSSTKFSKGYKGKYKPPISRQSGGTSGDLTIEGYVPETPVVPYEPVGPTRSQSSIPSIRDPGLAATKAETRQAQLIDRYVTKAYSHRLKKKGVSTLEIGTRVAKAKSKLEEDREALLSHPAVKEANAEGKVVSAKGLQKIRRTDAQLQSIKPPSGLKTTRKYGTSPRGLILNKTDREKLERQAGTPQGSVGRTQAIAKQRRQEEGQPSTFEALSIASLGIPGIGIGGEVAKLGQLGATAIPKIFAEGAAKQLISGAAIKAGAKYAAGKAAIKELPQTLKATPQLAKAGLKASPKAAAQALRSAPKTVPRAVGRGAVQTGKTTYNVGSGLGVLAATEQAGINTQPGKVADAILRGTNAAVLNHPLETAENTARAIPAAVTAPAALLYGVGQIPSEGTGPLEKTAEMQFEGLKQITSNVFSGDPKRVQKAVQGEGALAFLTPLPALTRTKAYKAVRSDVRGAAAGVRRTTGKGRQAPKGVEQSVFGFTDARQARRRVATAHTRATNPHRISEARHEKAILHGSARRPALEKVPPEWGHTISTLLEAGIRSPEGVKLMRERGPKTKPSEIGRINLDAALRIAEKNPEMFQSKPFLRALRAAERASKSNPAALAGMGEVARYRTQGELLGVLPPDRAVPLEARPYTSAKDRAGAWKQLDEMEKRLGTLKLKRQAKGPQSQRASRRRAEITTLEKRIEGLRKGLDPYTRPTQKTAAGKRRFWDEKLEKEYIAKVKARQEKSPLVEPAWTHDAPFESAKLGMEPGALPGKAGGKVYVNLGKLVKSDQVDRSLQAFLSGTVQRPRRRQAGADFAREFVRQEKLPYTLNGKAKNIVPDSETWARITSPKTKDNPDGGQFDPQTYARFPIREWKTAVEDPFTSEKDLTGLLIEAEAGRISPHEPSVIVPREAIREFKSIANPEHGPVTQFMNALGRTSSRLILGTNPSWLVAQTVAEGIPLLLAKPSLLNPVKTGSILKEIHQFRKENPEKAAVIEGAAGASPEITAGTLRSPLDLEKQNSFNPRPEMFAEAAKELTKGKWGRAMRSTAKLELFGLFDIKRQNAYRQVLLAAEADKRFRSWTSSVQGMYRTSSKVSERFRGKSRQEMYEWLTSTKEGKQELGKLADYVDNVQGNWTAFSRYERAFAPFVIFYPFLRYSLRWALWTFPKTHPLAATIAYTLGQVNSNELEKVLGAKPASPLSYSWPVVSDAEGKKDVLPGGSRIAPGQSVIQQAIVGGKPSQLIGGLNPILGAGLTALGGPGPFGDRPSGPAGWAAADQLLSLPAPLRLADVKSEKVAAMLGLARPQPESVIAKAFEKLDPNKKFRQGLLPSVPQSGKEARMSNQLSRALAEASANSKSKREDVAGDDSLTVKERQRQIKAMEKRSDKAKNTIDSILKKLGLDKENEEAYERYKAALYGGDEGDSSIYAAPEKGKGTIYDKPSGSTSNIYGDESQNPALKYKPPGAGGISLPDIGGALGAITNPLASLALGEKAQAAEIPKRLQRKTLGNPTSQELIKAGREGTLKLDARGRITTPKIREAKKELARVRKQFDKESGGRLVGIENDDQRRFAESLSKYSGIPLKLAGEWALQEGGAWGSDGVSGGNAGEQNWLGVGYPGQQTAMSQSGYFNGVTPEQAGKNTALWLEGKIGSEYSYRAADSILGISKLAKSGAPEEEIRSYIEGPSAWGTGTIPQRGVTVKAARQVSPATKAQLKRAEKQARALGVPLDEGPAPKPAWMLGGPNAKGVKSAIEVVGRKELGKWLKPTNSGTAGYFRNIANLNPVLAAQLVKVARESGEPITVTSGYRSMEDQANIDPGTNPKAPVGYSEHQFGMAADTEMSAKQEALLPKYGLQKGSGGPSTPGNDPPHTSLIDTDLIKKAMRFGPIRAAWGPEEWNSVGDLGDFSLPANPSAEGAVVPTGVGTLVSASSAPAAESVMASNASGEVSRQQPRQTKAERLELVNLITEGDYSKLGIPGFTAKEGPTVSELAALGRALEEQRQKLRAL